MNGGSKLVGKAIASASAVHDYMQVSFSDGSGLNVYNQYVITGTGDGALSELDGRKVIAVRETAEAVFVDLTDACVLMVTKATREHDGPELMEFNDGATIVVWQN
jgi:hypothetical protein